MWLVWREYNSHTLEDRELKSLLIHTLFKLASRKAFYTFFFFLHDRISTYSIHSIIITLFIIMPKHQSVFGKEKIQTPNLLFDNKKIYWFN